MLHTGTLVPCTACAPFQGWDILWYLWVYCIHCWHYILQLVLVVFPLPVCTCQSSLCQWNCPLLLNPRVLLCWISNQWWVRRTTKASWLLFPFSWISASPLSPPECNTVCYQVPDWSLFLVFILFLTWFFCLFQFSYTDFVFRTYWYIVVGIIHVWGTALSIINAREPVLGN